MRRKLSTRDEPTRSPLLHRLGCDSKHREYFGHNLSHCVRHLRSRWDFGVGLEAYEEVFYFVKEFDERLTARCGVPRRLREAVLSQPTQWD